MPTRSIHATRSAEDESCSGWRITGPPSRCASATRLGSSSAGDGRSDSGSAASASPAIAHASRSMPPGKRSSQGSSG